MTDLLMSPPDDAPPMSARDRIPPYDEDAEQQVLSAMMLDRRAIGKAQSVVTAEAFYRERHRRIFRAIATLAARDVAADELTIAEELRRNGELESVGGREFLSQVADAAPTAVNVTAHAEIVKDRYGRRQIIHAATQAISEAYAGRIDAQTIAQHLGAETLGIAIEADDERGFVRFNPIEVGEEMERTERGEAVIIPTGFKDIDHNLHGGARAGQLMAVGGCPGMGKSAMVDLIALHNAIAGRGAAIFSIEMTRLEVSQRLMAAASTVPGAAIQRGHLTPAQAHKFGTTARDLIGIPLWICDVPGITLDDLRTRAIGLKAEHPELRVLVVDYLQLVSHYLKGRRGDEELNAVSRTLKEIAKRTETLVIAAAQLNSKEIEAREDKRPTRRDFQGFSGLLNDAHLVALLFRERYYTDNAPDVIDVEFAKNRSGPRFTSTLPWSGEITRIEGGPFPPLGWARITEHDQQLTAPL